MANKVFTINEYAELEGVSPQAIRMRMYRGKLKYVRRYGVALVVPTSDKSIKKPRKSKK